MALDDGLRPDHISGLTVAVRLLRQQHLKLSTEYKYLARGMFGRRTKRHHEINGASCALVELAESMLRAAERAAADQSEPQPTAK